MHAKPNKKCLFLFTELAGYVLACLKQLGELNELEVHVVKWPVNAVAPFEFSLTGKNLFFYERKDFSDTELLNFSAKLNPDIIFCSGWVDKGYNAICRKFFGEVNTVMGLDNPWRGTIRQHVATIAGRMYLHKMFSHCWVPGSSQKNYAIKLGFRQSSIKDGIYSCDYEVFHQHYRNNLEAKSQTFPKRIIFVGRYTKLKGVSELWKAFVNFQEKQPCDWELWCLGKGELEHEFPVHDKIKNFGFVQPGEMKKFMAGTGVFILPSHYEHWGVVVHEFAAAGFPIICTPTTGAAEAFLEDGYNGFAVQPYDIDSLIHIFKKLSQSSNSELLLMGDHSAEMAKKITPHTWAKTFLEFLNN